MLGTIRTKESMMNPSARHQNPAYDSAPSPTGPAAGDPARNDRKNASLCSRATQRSPCFIINDTGRV